MGRSTKESWLQGPGDLKEDTVEDVPKKGESVLVRGLPAAYSNDAIYSAMEVTTTGEGARQKQTAKMNKTRLEAIQFSKGVVEPQFSEEDALLIAQKYGPAFCRVVDRIDELSGLDKESIEATEATFPSGGATPAGDGDVPGRTGSS